MKQAGGIFVMLLLLVLLAVGLAKCDNDDKSNAKAEAIIFTKSAGNKSSYWYDAPSERRRKADEMVESWKDGSYQNRTGHKPPLYGDN